MSLLYPLMWLAAAGIAVPIWLHLPRRNETNLVEFSAMRFLDDQPVARARPMWPRDWLLMLLRIVALLLLIAAFTWPYQQQDEPVVIEESHVYVLDNSLSHQLNDQFETRRDWLADELESAGLATQIAVVELNGTPRTVVNFGNAATGAATVRSLAPGAARGSYLDALRTANELLQTSLGRTRKIILLGDSQSNQWQEEAGSQPFLSGEEVELPEVDHPSVPNLHLIQPMARRLTENGVERIECVVRIVRHGSAQKVTVVFAEGDRELATQEVEFVDELEESESVSVFADWEAPTNQWFLGTASLKAESDSLTADNTVYFSLSPSRAGRVLVIADSRFLRQALHPDVMRGRWTARFMDDPQADDFSGDEPPDVVVVESRKLTSATVRDGVRDTLNAGRGVVLLVDRATPLIVGFLREMGIEMPAREERSGTAATFRYVFSEHPIFKVFGSSDFGDLSAISIEQHRRLKIDQALPLAFAASGDPLIFDVQNSSGRLLVFAFGFDREETNWPVHPTFVPFVDSCLTHVRSLTVTQTAYEPAEAVVWESPRDTPSKKLVVTHQAKVPKGTTAPLTQSPFEVEIIDGQARFPLPPQVGHYELRFENSDDVQAVLDVNPSPHESELTFDPQPDVLQSWRLPEVSDTGEDALNDQTDAIELSRLEILQQDLWWWFLLAALVAILLESLWVSRTRNPYVETND